MSTAKQRHRRQRRFLFAKYRTYTEKWRAYIRRHDVVDFHISFPSQEWIQASDEEKAKTYLRIVTTGKPLDPKELDKLL